MCVGEVYFSPYAKMPLNEWSAGKVDSGQQSVPSIVSEKTNFKLMQDKNLTDIL